MAEDWPRNAVDDEWYREQRRAVEAFFAQPNQTASDESEHRSPSGRYRLIVREYAPTPGYTRGLVYAGDRLIGDVKRNYGIFHHGWAEAHANGHDYLLCGEDYQGQTVIELDTSRRADYIPENAKNGSGFCCAAYYPSPDGRLIVVDGCYWGCPYELVVCRFDDPLALSWPEIERIGLSLEPLGWTDEGFIYEESDAIRISNGTTGQRKCRYVRLANGDRRLLEERVERES